MPRRPYTASPAARCAASRAVARLGARGAPSSLPATGLVTDTVAARAAIAVARRLVARPARARALARLARHAARGPAPRSRTAPIRERHRGAAAAHTLVVLLTEQTVRVFTPSRKCIF